MGINDFGGLLGNVGGVLNGSPFGQQGWSPYWTTITTNDTASSNTITIGAWGGDDADEPEEPAPSTPIAWLDERVTGITSKGRRLLDAAA